MDTKEQQDSLWSQDESLKPLRARLATKPEGIQLISFDFFDTLICRLCAEPSDLFIEVGRQLAQRGLLARPMAPVEFRAARIAADDQARRAALRKGRFPEIRLADIYQELKQVVTDPGAARQVEFDVERAFCYVNPAMVSLLRHVRALGCKTCLASDTYFTAAELAQLLRDHGLSLSLFDRVFVSSECGKAKWSGDLYQEILRQFDLHPSEVLHIGDNQHADVNCARQAGIEPLHYYKASPAIDPVFKSERALTGTNTHLAGSLNSLRVMTARRSESSQDAFRDGAMVFGPILSRYADWCVESFRAAGVRKVFALMREGELLGELVRRAAAAAGVELEVIPCYVSRMSTARAALPEITVDSTMSLLEGCGAVTPQAILQILGMEAEITSPPDPAAWRKPIGSLDAIRECVRMMFQLPGFAQAAEAKRLASHKLAFDYLAARLGAEETLGVLDLGWSGSIQRNVARILRLGGRSVRTVGCYLACTQRAGRLALEGDIAHAYLESEWCRSTILAEIAITACVGSTDGYRRNSAGEVEPVLGSYQITPGERALKARLRDGVLAFQTHWLALRWAQGRPPLTPETLADLDRAAASILYRLLEFPTKAEADRLGMLQHDENYFGQNLSAPLCDEESVRRVRQEGVLELFRRSQCYWPQGVVAQSFPRLVSALRGTWTDLLALGRLGAWQAAAPTDSGLTDEELVWLKRFLRASELGQVVFFGTLTPTLAAALHESLPVVEGKQRQVVVVGPAPEASSALSLPASCVHIPISTVDADLLERIRQHLSPQGDTALVLSSDVAAQSAQLLLNGLAPFLGQHGLILAPSGRFDTATRAHDSALLKGLEEWQNQTGTDLGFNLWQGPQNVLSLMCSWLILRRAPEAAMWNRHWMPKIRDLAGWTPPNPTAESPVPAESGSEPLEALTAAQK